MNEFLMSKGIDVVESDLGERILQLMHLAPSHIVMPAIHIKREQISEMMEREMGTEKGNIDPTYLTHAARKNLREKFLHADVAMTGEITLRGEVLEIGGLKEKLLAALRGGIKKVLIPESNVKDLTEIPDNVKTGMEIVPVRWIDKVLEEALVRKPEPLKAKEETTSVVATSAVTGVAVADAVSAVVH